MVCVLMATTEELCSTSFPFRFMTGGGPLLPPYHTPFLSISLALCVRQNGVHGIAGSLAHVIATFVLSRLALSVIELVVVVVHNRSTYVFFLLSQQSTFETPLCPPPASPPSPSFPHTFCTFPLHLEEKKEKACPVMRSASRCVCASRCSSSHLESGISRQGVLLRERERESEPQNALSAFVCALCVKILYELGGCGHKRVLSVVVHFLAFVGFQFLERETERMRAQEASSHIRQ
jgi:hypothetical protein